MTWEGWARGELEQMRGLDRERRIVDFDARGVAGLLDGRRVVSFASNDYLGLTTHPVVVEAARAALDRWGAGAGAARLTVGARPVHRALENAIAAWKETEAALVFSSGYAANVGTLAVVGRRADLILSDELNHASIIDGCRAARTVVDVYPHLDVDYVAAALRAATGPAVVVTDAVFSMDGDVAQVTELSEVCAAHGALLVVDEAHAVLDTPRPSPAAEVIRLGTMSKFLGSLGGFAAGPRTLISLLVNRARSFVFSTAPTPADTAAALAALDIVRSPEGAALKAHLRAVIERLDSAHRSPIVPVVLGSDARALEASGRLLEQGMFVPAIRPPSVPEGTARLRVALSAAHSTEQVETLATALAAFDPVHV